MKRRTKRPRGPRPLLLGEPVRQDPYASCVRSGDVGIMLAPIRRFVIGPRVSFILLKHQSIDVVAAIICLAVLHTPRYLRSVNIFDDHIKEKMDVCL